MTLLLNVCRVPDDDDGTTPKEGGLSLGSDTCRNAAALWKQGRFCYLRPCFSRLCDLPAFRLKTNRDANLAIPGELGMRFAEVYQGPMG